MEVKSLMFNWICTWNSSSCRDSASRCYCNWSSWNTRWGWNTRWFIPGIYTNNHISAIWGYTVLTRGRCCIACRATCFTVLVSFASAIIRLCRCHADRTGFICIKNSTCSTVGKTGFTPIFISIRSTIPLRAIAPTSRWCSFGIRHPTAVALGVTILGAVFALTIITHITPFCTTWNRGAIYALATSKVSSRSFAAEIVTRWTLADRSISIIFRKAIGPYCVVRTWTGPCTSTSRVVRRYDTIFFLIYVHFKHETCEQFSKRCGIRTARR